jgi:hypothetical protein
LRRLLAGISFLVLATGAGAEPVDVAVEPIASFQRLSSSSDFGAFDWRGGLTLVSPAEDFGGFSGLVLGKNCEDLLAVSDRGNWLTARLIYEGDTLADFADAAMAPIRDSKGRPPKSKQWGDSEALTRLADGRLAVGFESRVRFGAFDLTKKGLDARFSPLPFPLDIDAGPENGEIEALGQLPNGRLIAIAEQLLDAEGNIRGWAWKGEAASYFSIVPNGDYRVTDLAVDGDSVLTLERRFSTGTLPGMAIRRFAVSDITGDRPVEPELLLEATAPLYVIDNMEAMALCEREGETRVTLMSDDNFHTSVQSNIILQFAYRR